MCVVFRYFPLTTPSCPARYADWRGRDSQNFAVFGYARSEMSTATFRTTIANLLTCRIDEEKEG